MSRVAVLVAVAAAVLAAGCGSAIGDPLRVLPCTPSDGELDKLIRDPEKSRPWYDVARDEGGD